MLEHSHAPVLRAPTTAEVDRIATLRDPVVRNLQVTQCYFELSLALRRAIGPSANWCTFATWASKQAGQTIRKEDLARTLEAKLKYGPAAAPLPPGAVGEPTPIQALPTDVWQAFDPTAPFTRASEAVARGNLKVFAEIAREFARFLTDCLAAGAHDDFQSLEAFCGALRPGDPPEGQHYLRRAFTHYFLARAETNATRRAQFMLLANLEIGFHEQTRLQPEIVAAMAAPIIDPREVRDNITALLPAGRGLSRLRRFWDRQRGRPSAVDQAVDQAVDRLIAELREEARFLISDQLMAIELPQETRLRLGRDLRAAYPPSLQQIDVPELRDLLARIDPTPDSPQASGAADWGNLADRLHFIVELFRCYQEWTPLFEAPFTPTQVASLKLGQLPHGRL